MTKLLTITILLAVQLMSCLRFALAADIPRQPEMDNEEYRLDVVTNAYSRWWREVWDAGDNRFRFRLGSNSVSQWFIDEQLKLSTDLIHDRLRFRFYHSRIMPYSNESIGTDALEFEGQIYQRNYLSVYARPTSDKRESSLGFMLQHRKAVNRYFKISVEWPEFMRNFFEHHRHTPDSLLNIFTDRPVRFGLDAREEILNGVWVRAVGEYTPEFVMGEEVTATGVLYPKERAESKALSGWVEYVVDPSREVREQTAVGIGYSYQRSRKSKDVECGCSLSDDVYANGGGSPVGAVGAAAGDASSRMDDTAAAWPGGEDARNVPFTHFGRDLYQRTDVDSVEAWRDSRWSLAPYAWVVLSDRLVLRATVRVGEQEIGVGNTQSKTFYTTNAYVVPLVAVRYSFGRSRAAVLETGLVSEWRTYTEDRTEVGYGRLRVRREKFDDHRLYIAFEYVFSDSKIIRLNEAFELDAEDRGEFGIHDHGFFQLVFGF